MFDKIIKIINRGPNATPKKAALAVHKGNEKIRKFANAYLHQSSQKRKNLDFRNATAQDGS